MTDSLPDVQRGIKQSTLTGASSLSGQTTIPVYTTIDVGTNTTIVAVKIDESSLAGKTSLSEYIPISSIANNTTILFPVVPICIKYGAEIFNPVLHNYHLFFIIKFICVT